MSWKVAVVAVIALALALELAVLYGRSRWRAATRELHARMEAARESLAPRPYTLRELDGLPAPVQRYFRAVLAEGQPIVASATLEQTGTFNMSETGERWKPFESTQRIVTRRPGFVWDARISMAPAMTAHVRDAYAAGGGILTAAIHGLITVMNLPDSRELAQGELMRFLAEAVWYPTALLPSQGVRWEEIDGSQAAATLTDGATTVTLTFQFDEGGLIRSVRSDGRHRFAKGAWVSTPWRGRFWDYEVRDGMKIPLEGEVAWLSSQSVRPYWRGRLQRVEYEYVR